MAETWGYIANNGGTGTQTIKTQVDLTVVCNGGGPNGGPAQSTQTVSVTLTYDPITETITVGSAGTTRVISASNYGAWYRTEITFPNTGTVTLT